MCVGSSSLEGIRWKRWTLIRSARFAVWNEGASPFKNGCDKNPVGGGASQCYVEENFRYQCVYLTSRRHVVSSNRQVACVLYLGALTQFKAVLG